MTHVLLTGASSGIGEAMAFHFASLGWNLTLAARREDKLNEIASTLESEFFVRKTDLAIPQEPQLLFKDAKHALGITPTPPGMMHYNAAKTGLAASESLRVELKNSMGIEKKMYALFIRGFTK